MKSRIVLGTIGVLIILACGLFACIGVLLLNIAATPAVPLGDAVAVLYVEGPIVMGKPASDFSSDRSAYSESIISYLRQIQKNSSVKAVVVRIESPGGSVVASREIYDELVATRNTGKPIVASFGEVAASGGYYIAAAADKIYAHPATLTGSIGVISVLPNLEGLTDKVGIKMIVIKSGPHKDESYGYRDLTNEERAIWQKLIDEAYGDFVDVVAKGRHMAIDKAQSLADGRVYTGKQAKELGLADELGNLEAAVNAAAKLGNISGTPRKIEYRYRSGFFESLTSSFSPNQATLDLINRFALRDWGRVMYLYVAP